MGGKCCLECSFHRKHNQNPSKDQMYVLQSEISLLLFLSQEHQEQSENQATPLRACKRNRKLFPLLCIPACLNV